jgi:hypothetical protein
VLGLAPLERRGEQVAVEIGLKEAPEVRGFEPLQFERTMQEAVCLGSDPVIALDALGKS